MLSVDEKEAVLWPDVELTPLESSDLDLVHRWHNSAELRDLTMGFRLPVQRETVRQWIEGLSGGANAVRVVHCIRLRGQAAGLVQLQHISAQDRRGELGIFIAEPAARGKGLGFVACALALDFAFSGLNLHRVDLEVMVSSTSAIALYERLGFVREGTRREGYFADGQYRDSHHYGLLACAFCVPIPADARRLCAKLPKAP